MRDELILTTTARQLQRAGLSWAPQMGDWCALLGGQHLAEQRDGLWLVVDADSQVGWITIRDNSGRWPVARIASADALWLPTLGQLKNHLRARGFTISTFEAGTPRPHTSGPLAPQGWAAGLFGGMSAAQPSQARRPGTVTCQITHHMLPQPIQFFGLTEAEAVAEAIQWDLQRAVPSRQG